MENTVSETAATIREFIVDNFLMGQTDFDLNDEDSFMERRLIDSTGVLEIIFFLEESFGLKVSDEETIPENFDSVGRIARFVDRKKAS